MLPPHREGVDHDIKLDNLKKGFIVPSEAPYASPVYFAKKPGVDYHKLNDITKKDRYPIPLIEETLARLARARIFTKLDVRHSFNRIRLKESIEDLTTFWTCYGSLILHIPSSPLRLLQWTGILSALYQFDII